VIIVVGENVVDLMPTPDGLLRPALGGGPANIAVAAARLGAPVAMAARLGRDAFGAAFRRRLEESTVDIRYLVETGNPSALALATLGPSGEARYDFWLAGAADFTWRGPELPRPDPGDTLHLGSLAAFLPPGADALERWAEEHRTRCTITFDPNLRPVALARPDSLVRLERLVRLAHVVRASEGDLRLAYPSAEPMATARRWIAADGGPALVVLTHGAGGVTALTPGGEVSVPAAPVSVVDTIGAGDTAMGALLADLHARGALAPGGGLPPPAGVLRETLRFVCSAAAFTCGRPGADPPTAAELAGAG
jgi:fructokinase